MSYALDMSGQYAPGRMGGPLTDEHVQRCLARGIDRWHIDTAVPDVARQQIDVLVRHPVQIETFRAYNWVDLQGQRQGDGDFIDEIRRNAYNLQKHWIDLEIPRNNVPQNKADTHWLIDSFAGVCPTGLYSNPGFWQQYMGNTDEFAFMPWWVAHWNASDSLTDFAHFGGITSCEIHQTLSNLYVEGVWCDTNYYERPTPPPAPQPIPLPRLEIVSTEIVGTGPEYEIRQKVRLAA